MSRLDFILLLFCIPFGLAAGFFLGSGNFGGFTGAIIPGLIAGAFVSSICFKDGLWLAGISLIVLSLVGSLLVPMVPDQYVLKRLGREQTMLVIHVGSYRLGGGQ